jgi:hypothetical protein
MRTFVVATACILIFATAPAVAQNCAAIQAACVDQCQGTSGQIGSLPAALFAFTPAGRVKACIERCFITPCQESPLSARLCDATAQSICSQSFRACNDACVPSTRRLRLESRLWLRVGPFVVPSSSAVSRRATAT